MVYGNRSDDDLNHNQRESHKPFSMAKTDYSNDLLGRSTTVVTTVRTTADRGLLRNGVGVGGAETAVTTVVHTQPTKANYFSPYRYLLTLNVGFIEFT
jgi:hypothetical protein